MKKRTIQSAAVLMFAFAGVSCAEAGSQNDETSASGSDSKKNEAKKEDKKKDKEEDKRKSIAIGTSPKSLNSEVITLDEETKMLSDYAGDNGLLVIFSCNTCPFVVAWEDRYNEVKSFCDDAGIGSVLINSNEAFRGKEDSPENMKKHAEENGYKVPYVIDEDHTIADDFGAKTTPHVFLFDAEMKLRYKGAVDDDYEDKEAVKEYYLKDAITALAAGEEINPKETKAIGCSIKRVKK